MMPSLTNGIAHSLTDLTMKFPYAISDFESLVTEQYYYADRTDRIPLLVVVNFVVIGGIA